ncbi:S-adenosyl-L-methionine-dependent methyltransferase [Endogone sp. FLAS-F59071]|nr:S-adenosyl-L-methionine-dependent methyltransferase [Endogone sp. FLAS-F59071]|eukprot:RUS17199.1 S-adenosyl-L-methionine-dependent methyltransferase [Endogone sp. FLAS-F59071]
MWHPNFHNFLMFRSQSSSTSPDGRRNLLSLFPEGFRITRTPMAQKYLLPTNVEEMERQAFQHYVFRQQLHGNFCAPVEEALERGIKVIQISCGTGVWIIEMARDFPASTFVGIDMVIPEPPNGIPPNCSFVKASALTKLPFPDKSFDYVYQRFVVMLYKQSDWPKAVSEIVRVTKPGGWVELFDTDMLMERPPKSYIKYENAWISSTRAKGIDVGAVRNLEGLLNGGGLKEIESDFVSCPVGWYDRVGELTGRNMELIRLATKQLAPIMKMREEEYEQWAVAVSKELEENRSWVNGYYAYGKK